MLMSVLDGKGVEQKIVAKAQESVTVASGVGLGETTRKVVLEANALRSGWVLQNKGTNAMLVSVDGTSNTATSFSVAAGGVFPFAGFPLITGEIGLYADAADSYVTAEW